jgi:hypothetical protein
MNRSPVEVDDQGVRLLRVNEHGALPKNTTMLPTR